MAIKTQYLTKNPCFTAGRTIQVEGLMLHSIGCPQPDPLVFVNNWNRASYDTACVHGFVGEEDTYITLPCFETSGIAWRAWHCASGSKGSANNTHVSVEMCEPSCIKYVGGASFTCSDHKRAVEFVERTTRNAVVLFAKLCLFHNLDPLADGVVISHAEGHKRGIASGHADPDHLWSQLGLDYNMDKFRHDVFCEMQKISKEDEIMDLQTFKQMWYEMRQELQDNDASTWSEEARDWAVSSGLIEGTGNSEFNGAWEDLLTREQLVTVLYRFAKMMDKA